MIEDIVRKEYAPICSSYMTRAYITVEATCVPMYNVCGAHVQGT